MDPNFYGFNNQLRESQRSSSRSSEQSRDSSTHSFTSSCYSGGIEYEHVTEDRYGVPVMQGFCPNPVLTQGICSGNMHSGMIASNQEVPQYAQMQTVQQPIGGGLQQIHQQPSPPTMLDSFAFDYDNDILSRTVIHVEPVDSNNTTVPISDEIGPEQQLTTQFDQQWMNEENGPLDNYSSDYPPEPTEFGNDYHGEEMTDDELSRCTSSNSFHSTFSSFSEASHTSHISAGSMYSRRGRPAKYVIGGLESEFLAQGSLDPEEKKRLLDRKRNNYAVKVSRDKKRNEQIRMMRAMKVVLQNSAKVEQKYANSKMVKDVITEIFHGFTADHQKILEDMLAKLEKSPRQKQHKSSER